MTSATLIYSPHLNEIPPPPKRGLTGAPYTTNGLVHYFQGSFRLYNRIVRWLVRPKHFSDSETLPRIQKHFPASKNTSQNPKHVPEFKNTSQNPKTLPRIQNTSQNPKTLPRIQNTSQNSKTLCRIQILGCVLDSGTCFGFWEVFWNLGSV